MGSPLPYTRATFVTGQTPQFVALGVPSSWALYPSGSSWRELDGHTDSDEPSAIGSLGRDDPSDDDHCPVSDASG